MNDDRSERSYFRFEFVVIFLGREILGHFEDFIVDVVETPLQCFGGSFGGRLSHCGARCRERDGREFPHNATSVSRYNHNWRLMSKEDSIEVTGTVVEKFPSGLFSVQLDQERTVLAHLAGKLRRNRIRVLAGDRVTLELSPYDLTKGRITYRHK